MSEAASSPPSALAALVRKSLRASGNAGRVLREQSRLKMLVIGIVAVGLTGGLGVLFHAGFAFIGSLGGPGLMIVQNLFALFFLGLGLMLVFSSTITAYTSIFRAEEMNFLLLKPMSIGHILIHKFWETAALSSWAFFFMVIPFIGAYAINQHLSLMLTVWTLCFAVPFVLVCGAVGTMLALLIVRFAPQGKWLWILCGVAALALAARYGLNLARDAKTVDDTQLVLSRLVPGMKLASHPLWPSWWMAEGILSLARDNAGRGLFLWSLLASTAAASCVLVEWVGRLVFNEAWHRRLPLVRKRRKAASLQGFEKAMGWLAGDMRGILIKDIRIFIRDPMQWSQALIFFGLLALYFSNLRTLRYHLYADVWRNVIVWLNMISVSAVMTSLSARFIYPQMSLEGQSFWVLGLSPMPMQRVLRAKFGLSFVALSTVGIALTLISTSMLGVGTELRLTAVVISVAVAASVSALSTGLGALFVDLRNRSPLAIISGFGGTLNLVLGLIVIFAAILPFAGLSHFFLIERVDLQTYRFWLGVLIVYLTALTLAATFIPLYLGRRSLDRREY
jgi:ABC-2 type transport system permease protein